MEDFEKTFFRLMTVYEHFMALELNEDYSQFKQTIIVGKKPIEYDALPFVYGQITSLFNDWIKITDDLIFYEPDTALEANQSMQHFFGLNDQEFCHLFTPSFQSVNKYGGELLTVKSGTQEVANNIKVFLEKELEKQHTRKNK
ncbi:MAG: hypothetical protein WBM13_11190 [Bacteroidia bacterium]